MLLALWGGLFLASLAWIVATPLGASPDEPAHIIRAASVARGEVIGEPTRQAAVRAVSVPEGIASAPSWPCYAFRPDMPASCTEQISDSTRLVTAETSAGLYNPSYYAIVGWPSLVLPDTSQAVLAMRGVSALIATFFVAAGFAALRMLTRSRAIALALGAAVTPMVLFLAASVNPNALEIATGFSLTAVLLLLLGAEPVRRRLPWLLLTGASGALLAQSRGLSPLWMAMIAVIVLVMTPWDRVVREIRRPGVIATVAVLGLAVLGAAGWSVATGTLGSMGNFPGATDSPARAFFNMLLRSFDPGLVGVFGWLDSPSPLYVQALWAFLSFAVVVAALAFANVREAIGIAIALFGLLVVPAIVQALSVRSSGYIWQGRYALIAYVCLLVVAGAVLARRIPQSVGLTSRLPVARMSVVVTVLIVVGQAWSLLSTLQRYQGGFTPDRTILAPVWSPPGGVLLWLVVVALGTVVAAVTAIVSTPGEPRRIEIDSTERSTAPASVS